MAQFSETESSPLPSPRAVPVSRARSSPRYQPAPFTTNPSWEALSERFFSQVQIDERWQSTVRDAAERGLVMYIGRSLSFLDFLALDHLTRRHGLPRIELCNDLGLGVLEPFPRGRRLGFGPTVSEEDALADTIDAGASALLFLRRPPSFEASARRGHDLEVDLIRVLVESQRRTERPIILLPQTFVWTKRQANRRPNLPNGLADLLLGPVEWPGRLRVLAHFLLNYQNAILRCGDPFDLGAFLREHPELDDEQAADRIRYLLLRRMERERAIVLGPAKKTAGRIVQELMRSPRVRAHLEQAAKENKKPLAEIESYARGELQQLCAALDMNVIDLFHRFLDQIVWTRIYDGLEVDREGLERVRAAARKGPLVLLPSHKSHVDYLVLSDVLYAHGLAVPLIAAGDNLSFFPVGPVLRRSGAFFIKRSFKGKKLYPQLVDAYVRKILVEGFNIEVFIEGARSRTGKLSPPKLGILSMIVDAALQLKDKEIAFVPIAIGYERIIEEGSYVHESGGGEKEPESFGQLLEARRVLRSKYGRLYMQFGEVLSFEELLSEAIALAGRNDRARGAPTLGRGESALSPSQRRAMVQRIAHRVTYEINRVTVVTPAALTATALMAHKRRGITHGQLMRSAEWMLAALTRWGARIGRPIFDEAGRLQAATLAETLRLFVDAKLLTVVDDGSLDPVTGAGVEEPIYAVPEERRIALEYHKNSVLHFFVPSALIASALLALGGEAETEALRERVRRISRLFKLEFMYRADADFDRIFEDALSSMKAAGEVEPLGSTAIRRAGGASGARITSYAEMLRTYFEAYRLGLGALRGLREDGDKSVPRKDWIRHTLALGKRRWLTGQITLRESVSRHKIENALAAFHDHQIVRLEGEDIRPYKEIDGEAYASIDAMTREHLLIE